MLPVFGVVEPSWYIGISTRRRKPPAREQYNNWLAMLEAWTVNHTLVEDGRLVVSEVCAGGYGAGWARERSARGEDRLVR